MSIIAPLSKLRKLWQLSRMDLVEPYREYFTMHLADSDALREAVFRLRYDVYCRELGWEDPGRFPAQLEQDAYDPYSLHCLLRHRRSDSYAGTVRLVTTADSPLQPPLPLIDHCGDGLFNGPLHPSRLPPGSFGEISRLALRGQFRRRPSEQDNPEGQGQELFAWNQTERRRFPHIALALYLAAAAAGLQRGLDGVYAMMEPRLARHLRFAGIRFEQVGAPVQFRGERAPYYVSRTALNRHLSRPLRRLLAVIGDDLRSPRHD